MRNVSELDGNIYQTGDRSLMLMFEDEDTFVIDVQAHRPGRVDYFPPFACLYLNTRTGGMDLNTYTYTPIEFVEQTELAKRQFGGEHASILPLSEMLGEFHVGEGRTLSIAQREDESIVIQLRDEGGNIGAFAFHPFDGRIVAVVTGREMFERKVDWNPQGPEDVSTDETKNEGVI